MQNLLVLFETIFDVGGFTSFPMSQLLHLKNYEVLTPKDPCVSNYQNCQN